MTTGPEYDGTRDVPIDPKTWDTSALKKEMSDDIDRQIDRLRRREDLIHYLYNGTLSPTVFE